MTHFRPLFSLVSKCEGIAIWCGFETAEFCKNSENVIWKIIKGWFTVRDSEICFVWLSRCVASEIKKTRKSWAFSLVEITAFIEWPDLTWQIQGVYCTYTPKLNKTALTESNKVSLSVFGSHSKYFKNFGHKWFQTGNKFICSFGLYHSTIMIRSNKLASNKNRCDINMK